jgi:hypothetical protein
MAAAAWVKSTDFWSASAMLKFGVLLFGLAFLGFLSLAAWGVVVTIFHYVFGIELPRPI